MENKVVDMNDYPDRSSSYTDEAEYIRSQYGTSKSPADRRVEEIASQMSRLSKPKKFSVIDSMALAVEYGLRDKGFPVDSDFGMFHHHLTVYPSREYKWEQEEREYREHRKTIESYKTQSSYNGELASIVNNIKRKAEKGAYEYSVKSGDLNYLSAMREGLEERGFSCNLTMGGLLKPYKLVIKWDKR